MARGAGVRSEISNSVGRASERERGRNGERRRGERERGREKERRVGRYLRATVIKIARAIIILKPAFLALSLSPLLPPGAHIRRVETGAAARKREERAEPGPAGRATERGGAPGRTRQRRQPERGWVIYFPPAPERAGERARARGIIYREDSRESTQRASERGRGRGTG